jgi:NTP pyrophosphatase (non-canonical NTP hydrolase)
MNLNELRDRALQIAVDHGFTEASVAEDIALMHSEMHSELSEALEYHRNHHSPEAYWYESDGKPCGIPSEMADVIIRVLHFCGKHNIDIESVVINKMNYNANRPYKHGNRGL